MRIVQVKCFVMISTLAKPCSSKKILLNKEKNKDRARRPQPHLPRPPILQANDVRKRVRGTTVGAVGRKSAIMVDQVDNASSTLLGRHISELSKLPLAVGVVVVGGGLLPPPNMAEQTVTGL